MFDKIIQVSHQSPTRDVNKNDEIVQVISGDKSFTRLLY